MEGGWLSYVVVLYRPRWRMVFSECRRCRDIAASIFVLRSGYSGLGEYKVRESAIGTVVL